jgi:hypothetical protein
MHVLRVEHGVRDFDAWKKAFDSDPIGREAGGVRRYRILRAEDDPNHALIDLEFDDAAAAETFLGALRELWGRVEGLNSPSGRIAEVVEST